MALGAEREYLPLSRSRQWARNKPCTTPGLPADTVPGPAPASPHLHRTGPCRGHGSTPCSSLADPAPQQAGRCPGFSHPIARAYVGCSRRRLFFTSPACTLKIPGCCLPVRPRDSIAGEVCFNRPAKWPPRLPETSGHATTNMAATAGRKRNSNLQIYRPQRHLLAGCRPCSMTTGNSATVRSAAVTATSPPSQRHFPAGCRHCSLSTGCSATFGPEAATATLYCTMDNLNFGH